MKRTNDLGLERELLEDGVLIVAFVMPNSIPCDHFLPEFKRFSEEMAMRTLLIDVDENPTIAKGLNVTDVPTTIVFRDGRQIQKLEGPYSYEALVERIGRAK